MWFQEHLLCSIHWWEYRWMLKGLWIEQSGFFSCHALSNVVLDFERVCNGWRCCILKQQLVIKTNGIISLPPSLQMQTAGPPSLTPSIYISDQHTQTMGWWVENGEDQTINIHRLQLRAKAPLVFPVAGSTEWFSGPAYSDIQLPAQNNVKRQEIKIEEKGVRIAESKQNIGSSLPRHTASYWSSAKFCCTSALHHIHSLDKVIIQDKDLQVCSQIVWYDFRVSATLIHKLSVLSLLTVANAPAMHHMNWLFLGFSSTRTQNERCWYTIGSCWEILRRALDCWGHAD